MDECLDFNKKYDKLDEALRRISNLEQHVINLIIPIQNICSALTDKSKIDALTRLATNPIMIDDRPLLARINELKNILEKIEIANKVWEQNQTAGEIKYIGNRLNEIEKSIKVIQQEGSRKNVHLDITLDGQKLQTRTLEKAELEEMNEDILKKIFSKLDSREKVILELTFGLCGKIPLTTKSIAGKLSVSSGRISEILRRIKRKLLKGDSIKIPKGHYPDMSQWLYQ